MTSYRVNLKDTSGNLVAVFDTWQKLNITRALNGVGTFSMVLNGDDSKIPLFQTDCQIEVWRRPTGEEWYLEWEGFFRAESRQTSQAGERLFTAEGYSYNHLLQRRIIAYKEGTSYSDKSDAAETVMKEYVLENAGTSATNPPRLGDGVFTGLSIQVDTSLGGLWEGSRSFKNLYEVLLEISQANHIDFDVVGTGAATFEFRTYYPYLGKDRTTNGLNIYTGLNASGYAPVVFSLRGDTMTGVEYRHDRSSEVNRVYVLGAGEQQNILVEVVDNATAIAASTWNQCETSQSASNETTTTALTAYGYYALYQLKAIQTLDFSALQQPSLIYGRDYFLGDLITAKYDEIEFDKKIVSVGISCDKDFREGINLGFQDAN